MPTKLAVKTEKKAEKKVEKKAIASVIKAGIKKDWVVPVLVGAIIVAAFAVGFLYGKVSVYEKMGLDGKGTTNGAAAQQAAQPEAKVAVSMDQIKDLFGDKSNIVFGDAKKKVLFVEFSDPSCPYCHIAAGKNPELNKQVGDRFILTADGGEYEAPVLAMKKLIDEGKAGYVWMYSPGHGNGELATQALYCAKDQNKFWEVHDLLMSSSGYDLLNETVKNDIANVDKLIEQVKNVVKAGDFKSCLTSGKYAARVQSDTAVSRKFGVQGTPSFFVNTKNFGGAYSFVDMQADVDAALK